MYLFFVLIIKESGYTILSRWSTGNLPDIFKDFPVQQKKFRTFPGCGNPVLITGKLRHKVMKFFW